MQKLKIVLIGPPQSGKSMIANSLSEVNENLEIYPTQGCRIVEFELNDIYVNQKSTNVLIELWDCSGQHKFSNCWPIIRHMAQGVVLVHTEYNQGTQQELDLLYNYFVTQNGLSAKCCLVFNHTGDRVGKLGSSFLRISQVKVDLAEVEVLKKDFSEFISSLLQEQSGDGRGSGSSRSGIQNYTGMY
ncbi:intraflagellar transport protein 22 homolog [Ctenocephalides felis]|uniref:intraflagellar transport protein 22 homolog n=1 Tax=Ctenocephalides felis TaxID=7515 RepID=UPI000E6E548F|nr:intraflagellar transport protein 22 homolog [Ctenocephalides felis]